MRKFIKPGGPVTGPGGTATPGYNDYFDGIAEAFNRIATGDTAIAALQGQKYDWPVFIEAPINKDYTLDLDVSFAGTINKVTTKSASGTCTATVKINTTALGGTANSVSSTEQEQEHSSANEFVAGDDIVLTVSANSLCEDMSLNIEYTRA